jgi:hypothetical protein
MNEQNSSMEQTKELNVNNSEKLTFRIGKYELAILRCLSYTGLDNSYKDVRKTIGLDPHELLKSYTTYINEPDIPEQLSKYRKKTMKKLLHKHQVTFTRALNSLIHKELIRRCWEILLKSDVDGDELGVDDGGKLRFGPFSDCNFLIVYSKDRDVPNLEIKAVKCCHSLTREGFMELSKRIPKEQYSDEMQRTFRTGKYAEVVSNE